MRFSRMLIIAGVLSAVPISAKSQSYIVTGLVTDSTKGMALVNASVILLMQTDSSLVQFTTTRNDGSFSFSKVIPSQYILQITYVGMQSFYHSFVVDKQNVDLDNIHLSPMSQDLEEFVVTDDRLPFVIRGDTIEYHALAFMIRPMDMVEDLLRRLPGIDVDRSGTITAHGETVENVLVENKEFFSNDPTIATKNLPADAVDQVQVYDKPSNLAELTGIPDGQEEKTINLKLTKDAKSGFLGQALAGLGEEQKEFDRYFGQGTLFRFAPRTQLAWIGGAENISKPVLSGQQLKGFTGVRSFRRDGIGYTESLGMGLNVSRDFATHATVNVSYLLSDKENREEDVTLRHQLLGGSRTALSNESRSKESGILSHEIGLSAEVNLGEGEDVVIRGNFEKSISETQLNSTERMESHSGITQNLARAFSDHSSDDLQGNVRLIWRKRISQSGRSLIVETSVSTGNSEADNNLHTDILLSIPNEVMTQKDVSQLQESQRTSFRHSQRIELLQPLKSGQNLTAYVERASLRQDHEKMFWNFDGKQRQLIKQLGDGLSENRTYLRSGLNFGWRAPDGSWFVSGDMKMQHSRRSGTTILKPDQEVKTSYTYLLPYVLGKYELGRDGDLDLFYQTRIHEPTIRQLQPFVDNSNSFRIYQGNPSLIPEYHHDLNLQYILHKSYSGLSLGVDIGISLIHNSIARSRTIDQNQLQSIREINSGDAWSRDAGFRIGSLIRSLGIDWTLRGRMRFNRQLEQINNVENIGKIQRHNIGVDLEFYRGDILEITTSGRIYWNKIKYSLNDELNQSYMSSQFSASFSGYIRNSWQLDVRFQYKMFDRDLFQNSQNIGLLHLTLSRFILAGRGNLSMEVHDLLNQNQGISLTNGASYIQEARTESLGRYLMLKFTYKPKLM